VIFALLYLKGNNQKMLSNINQVLHKIFYNVFLVHVFHKVIFKSKDKKYVYKELLNLMI